MAAVDRPRDVMAHQGVGLHHRPAGSILPNAQALIRGGAWADEVEADSPARPTAARPPVADSGKAPALVAGGTAPAPVSTATMAAGAGAGAGAVEPEPVAVPSPLIKPGATTTTNSNKSSARGAGPPTMAMPPLGPTPAKQLIPEEVLMRRRVFVGNMARQCTREKLIEFLSARFGEVHDANVIKDRENDTSKGYGFVTFKTEEQAHKCLAEKSMSFMGRQLNFGPAKRRDKRADLADRGRLPRSNSRARFSSARQPAISAGLPGLQDGTYYYAPSPYAPNMHTYYGMYPPMPREDFRQPYFVNSQVYQPPQPWVRPPHPGSYQGPPGLVAQSPGPAGQQPALGPPASPVPDDASTSSMSPHSVDAAGSMQAVFPPPAQYVMFNPYEQGPPMSPSQLVQTPQGLMYLATQTAGQGQGPMPPMPLQGDEAQLAGQMEQLMSMGPPTQPQ